MGGTATAPSDLSTIRVIGKMGRHGRADPPKARVWYLGGRLGDLPVPRRQDELSWLCTMPLKSCTLHRHAQRTKQNPVGNELNPSDFRY